MIKQELFGKLNNQDVYLFTLDSECGLVAKITNYGGIITHLIYKGTDVALGKETFEDYLDNKELFGAIVGRNANRIKNAEFVLNNKKYLLYKNDNGNNIHGGKVGFDSKLWDFEIEDTEEPSLILTLKSPDGEEGFPGNADIKVTYTVTKENSIRIHYEAVSDSDTVINLTNHSFFNLNGHDSGTTDGHTISLDADFYTPHNAESMPYGEILAVDNSIFDLRKPVKLSDVYESDEEQIKMFNGFDHNFCLKDRGFKKISELVGDKTGITMETYTDRYGVQIYSSNCLKEGTIGKNGAVYAPHHAICLETQSFPNAINLAHFPSPILKKGDKYDTITEYKFR